MTRHLLLAMMMISVGGMSAEARTIFVSNEKGNSISVVDGDTLELVEEVPVGQRPRGIVLGKDNKFLYICASDDDTIEVMDTETLEVVGTMPSGPDPELMVISPDGATIYVANEDDNLVSVVDIESRSIRAENPGGRRTRGHGRQPRRQDRGQYLGDHQYGPFHRHRDVRDHPQRPGRSTSAFCRVHRRQ